MHKLIHKEVIHMEKPTKETKEQQEKSCETQNEVKSSCGCGCMGTLKKG